MTASIDPRFPADGNLHTAYALLGKVREHIALYGYGFSPAESNQIANELGCVIAITAPLADRQARRETNLRNEASRYADVIDLETWIAERAAAEPTNATRQLSLFGSRRMAQ